ncbi:MAG: glycosyltransferase family 9 protein [Nitrospira sp.]|nr:glycosyltransferase family 9 protein [Nitrospira sp.]MBP6604897.1 glycosyltransferase family 9 protein [Nitrospira sp.]HQY58642.1 glycosyltransferase family 9 protein [Nitrospira sp.]
MIDIVRRLLLIKPSSLGDIVHTMPTLAALRERFPQAEVTWLVKRQWAPLVEVIAGVDHVCSVSEGLRGWLGRVPALRGAGYDLVVDLQGLFRSGAMALLAGCGRRVGFATAREGSPLFYTQRVAVPPAPIHAVDRYLLVAEALGATRPIEPRFEFIDRSGDQQAVDTMLTRAGITPHQVWIAMNVSARWETKRWPPQHFAEVADRLSQSHGLPVVLIGGPAERPESLAVTALMRTKAIDLTGQTPVGLLPGLLRRASLLVTNDSGPMHIAAAVGTPVVALFGPTDPVKTGPYGKGHVVLSYAVECRPCFRRDCARPVPLECLTAVRPDQVVRAVEQHLERSHKPGSL